MVHQLLLCSSISQSNYIQTVSTLQALTGVLHPQDIATYTLLTKPHNVFKPKVEPGKVNQIEQYYMRCTTTWNDNDAMRLNLAQPIDPTQSDIRVERLFSGKKVNHWTLQISDMPNAGKNPVLAHNFYESTVVHHHTARHVSTKAEPNANQPPTAEQDDIMQIDSAPNGSPIRVDSESDIVEVQPDKADEAINNGTQNEEKKPEDQVAGTQNNEIESIEVKDSFLQFLEELGYDVVNQYWQKGIRFFHGDIVIEIFKIFVRDDDPAATSEGEKLKLKLLDESNTFQIKAFINYPRGASVDLVNQGIKDLVKLKGTLHNLFELEVPDRTYMDSRVTRVL